MAMREDGAALPEMMRAVVCHGPRDYRLEPVAVPRPAPGEIILKVHDCGICASDIKCYSGAPLFWGDEYRAAYVDGPVIAGHEFTGEVVALGDGAGERHAVAVGDRVVAEQIVPCGECRYCRTGLYWLCIRANIFGFKKYVHGGMAEFMKLPDKALVYKVPDSVSHKHAALIEPLACALHAVERGEIKLGDVVVQVGCGTLGLCMVAAERLKNPGLLIALDLIDSRLELARGFGADLTFNPNDGGVVQKVLDLTDGYGCDVLIEATGNPEAIVPSLHMIRKAGTFVEFSVMKGLSAADWTIIGDGKELNIHGAHLGPYTFPVAIDYLERGLINIEPIVTHEFALADFEQGLAAVEHPEDSIKVLLKP
ncbi:MAG TPA: alcohol dehydrogenase catalytic domain-containing protein [Candidatus Hydrogenedentes bacterium]|nr:alcohol dehydrogenase catalytic domain-containing protein [Candidatus Hydrogenedentota bacterium]HPG69650.1 alcohol dehydrogenase catalytic domain-containing protein [Candidatus Hydrogenedentota bacterium]